MGDAHGPKVTHVIFDLDGTLIDTESLVRDIQRIIVERCGKVWSRDGDENRLKKRELEGASSLIEQFELPLTPQELIQQSQELIQDRWQHVKVLPGAHRLIAHLRRHHIPMALASSSLRKNIITKLSFHTEWSDAFIVSVSGDEVGEGKPHPELFLKTASLLGADPRHCLVIEDTPAGVAAAKAAGMRCVAVPSLPKKHSRPLYNDADVIATSLLDVRPEEWGLPPFQDWVGEALPVPVWRLGGPVIKGFGRGSKLLGIPTANLPLEAISSELADHVCGIYLGWAALPQPHRGVYKMVMSVGWNPFFDNVEKAVEPWLLHEFPDDFYDEELRLVVVGYIRPEADFTSLENLVARIHKDGDVARQALDLPMFAKYKDDDFLNELLERGNAAPPLAAVGNGESTPFCD